MHYPRGPSMNTSYHDQRTAASWQTEPTATRTLQTGNFVRRTHPSQGEWKSFRNLNRSFSFLSSLGALHQNHVGHLSKIQTISDTTHTLEIGPRNQCFFYGTEAWLSLPRECQASFLLHFSNGNKSILINRYQYFILSTTDYSHGHITLHTFLKNGHENLRVSWTWHF